MIECMCVCTSIKMLFAKYEIMCHKAVSVAAETVFFKASILICGPFFYNLSILATNNESKHTT